MANKIKYGIKSCYYEPITAFANTGAATTALLPDTEESSLE